MGKFLRFFISFALAFLITQIALHTVLAINNYVPVSLSQVANAPLSGTYISPPAGNVTLDDIAFNIPADNNMLITIGQNSSYIVNTNIINTFKVYLLINSFNTRISYNNLKLGEVKLEFSDNTVHTTNIVIGKNIREWRQGNDAFETVNTVTDPNSQEVFNGQPTHLAGPAKIDMLTITLPNNFKGKTLTKVTVTDLINEPGILLMGISANGNSPPTAPEPFLELPWDYEGEGLTFNEAALAINSFFDHEYPLLSANLNEPSGTLGFDNETPPERNYSAHDGYDYGRDARANIGTPVLAAAAGTATFSNDCSACGNMILIDHGNGYQTRYFHLQEDSLIVNQEGEETNVTQGQQIGRVGATGHVIPEGELGAHIHFMVIHDKDQDLDFQDNIPDGVTDPFGWQSSEQDPWPDYTFFYGGQNRTGNPSFYLWQKAIANLSEQLTSNGAFFEMQRYSLNFPQGTTNQDLNISMKSSPLVKVSNTLKSIGSALTVTATDLFGNIVNTFQGFFTININFSTFDLTPYKTETISIYSSNDGVNWQKEETSVDMVTKTASASLNHLTHFALVAERKDTVAPTTTAILEGEQGQPNWFRSDVQLTFGAQDNTNGLGVDYTLYKIDDEDWQDFTQPITISGEGSHEIDFYSVDNDENIEEIKSVEFKIDKTLPQANIQAEPLILWPPDGKMVNITITGSASDDQTLTDVSFVVEDEYDQIEPQIISSGQTIQLQASRKGNDQDGRKYKIKIIATDVAGNMTESIVEVIVPHNIQ